jgi:2-polyprenyl-3-methyl-5-hydroxy-6-metoxy-1,4-benzoquinol methylase
MRCNLCGSSSQVKLYNGRENKSYTYYNNGNYGLIVKCAKCGLVYSPNLDKDLEKKYQEVTDQDYLKSKEARLETFKRDLLEIEKIKKIGKILDVGCGPGLFLDVARSRGWKGEGVELSRWACECCKKLKLRVINKSLEKAGFKPHFFDVITLWDVIEHVDNPTKLLKQINKLLNKEGILVLNTPNIGSLFAKIMGKKWWNLMSMHIFYFDRNTITNILEKNGFKVIKIKSYSRVVILKYAIRWLKNHRVLFKICDILFNKSPLGKVRVNVNFFDNMVVYAKKAN